MIDDGGTAFVVPPQYQHPDGTWADEPYSYGMSLRDWFAGYALIGLYMQGKIHGADGRALDAYAQADAMLRERAKAVPNPQQQEPEGAEG